MSDGDAVSAGLEETALAQDSQATGLEETIAPPSGLDAAALPEQARSDPNAELSLTRGDALGRYVVLELLGKGGMGEVYSAYDPTLDRRVALKVLRPALGTGDSATAARARLTREAQAMAQLAHPNVIQVFDVGTVDGDVYVAMEFVDGVDLREWLKGDHDWQAILAVFRSAANGLAAAHEAGLVHRDFKPDNVLIGNDGRVRVIDFGIASLGSHEENPASDAIIETLTRSRRSVAGAHTTLTGVAAGTPAYMAPEQFIGLPCDARTDQFSFSVALYEALCKERPFGDGSISDLFSNVTEGKRRPLPETSEVPQWLHAAISRSLSVAPDERFESMHALLRALTAPRAWLRRHQVLVAISAMLAGGALLTLLALQPEKASQPCEGQERLLAGIWDPQRAQQVQAHFATSSLSYAGATSEKIVAQLNAHSERWQLARKSLCQAAVRKDLSGDLKDRGMACLDRRLRELDAVATILSSATDETIKDAPITTSELSSVADCTNTTLLATDSAELPPQWAEIANQFPELKAVFLSSQYEELLKKATGLHRLSVERGYALGEGETLNWIALAERALTKLEQAEEHHFEAIRIGQKENVPRLRADAWTGLMSIAADVDKPKEGLRWLKHAEIANEQAGVDPELQAKMTYLDGYLNYKLQNYELALGRFQASAALYERIFGPSHWRVATNLSVASACLREMGRNDEAFAVSARALSTAIAALGPEHPRLAGLNNGTANTLGRMMRYDEAREHYKEALRLTIASRGERHVSVAMYLFNQANMELRAGQFELALRLATEAHALREEKLGRGHAAVARTLSTIAKAHFRMGDLTKATELQSDVVKRYQLIYGDDDRITGSEHTVLCDYLRRGKQYGKARVSCTKALSILDPDAPDQRDLALALTNSAWLDLAQGDQANALERSQRAWRLRKEHEDLPGPEAQTRFVMGLALHAQGQQAEGLEQVRSAKQAIETGEPGFKHDLPEIEAFLSSTEPPR